MSRFTVRIFLFAGLLVCSLASSLHAKPLSEAEAIALARAEVTKREAWADQASFVAEPKSGGWSVSVYWLAFPTKKGLAQLGPDGFRTIRIDHKGKIVSYRGL